MPTITKEYIKQCTDVAIGNGINRLCEIIHKKSSSDGDAISALKLLLELRGERGVTPDLEDLHTLTAKPEPAPAPTPSKVAVKI